MESTGEMDKIQVTEATAHILTQAGYPCKYRGETYVKGKGNLRTYFVEMQPVNLDIYETMDDLCGDEASTSF